MHEILILFLNIYIFGLVFNYFIKLNIYLCIIISFIIVWILFLNVNPYKYDQNKFTILSYIPNEYIPKMNMLQNTNINNLQYPVIFKPVKCTKVGTNVEVINNISDAKKYLEKNNITEIMVQNFVPYQNEVGILYENKIISMVTKKSKDSNIMTSCYGSVKCEDITYLITSELNDIIIKISNNIPNFNVGRYDIKYRDLESLLQGRNFYILEVNGTMGFDLRKSNLKYCGIPSILYIERWFFIRHMQGIKNIITLNGYNPIELIKVMLLTMYNTIYCSDWEKLFALYT